MTCNIYQLTLSLGSLYSFIFRVQSSTSHNSQDVLPPVQFLRFFSDMILRFQARRNIHHHSTTLVVASRPFNTVNQCLCLTLVPTSRPEQAEDVCYMPSSPGECNNYEQRYFFDSEEGQCKSFVYGGCGGNKNNFASIAECENYCGNWKKIPTEEEFLTGEDVVLGREEEEGRGLGQGNRLREGVREREED